MPANQGSMKLCLSPLNIWPLNLPPSQMWIVFNRPLKKIKKKSQKAKRNSKCDCETDRGTSIVQSRLSVSFWKICSEVFPQQAKVWILQVSHSSIKTYWFSMHLASSNQFSSQRFLFECSIRLIFFEMKWFYESIDGTLHSWTKSTNFRMMKWRAEEPKSDFSLTF